jgi:hypothetical protein
MEDQVEMVEESYLVREAQEDLEEMAEIAEILVSVP